MDYEPLNVTKNSDNGGNGDFTSPADITVPLQWAASNLWSHKKRIFVPNGQWTISSTVTFPYRTGLIFHGEGSGPLNTNSVYTGGITEFWWGGPSGGTMFEFRGTEHDIGHFGCYNAAGKESTAILIDRDPGADGLGTGKMRFWPLYFEGFQNGIQLEETIDGSASCDNITFQWLTGSNTERILYMNGEQAMDIHIMKMMPRNGCDYGIYCQGGGNVHLEHVMVGNAGVTLLYIPNGADVGNNNGIYTIEHVKVDNRAGSDFTLVEQLHRSGLVRIHVNNIMMSGDNFDGNFATLTGWTYLTLGQSSGSFKSITGVPYAGRTPTVVLHNCNCEVDPTTIFAGTLRYRVENCVNNLCEWWPDFETDYLRKIIANNSRY